MAQIKINGSMCPISASLSRLAGFGKNPHGLLDALGNEMIVNTRDRVERGVTPAGSPFAPLNPLYASGKLGPSILIGRGGCGSGLMGPLVHRVDGSRLVWGSGKDYAAIHQFGGIIRPKTKPALKFQMGGRWFVRKAVTIPARPYLGFNKDDEEVVMDTLEKFLKRMLRG